MKKLFNVLVLMLAVNFLAVAGAVVYLKQTGHIDAERVSAIRAILFPASDVVEVASTQPADPSSTQPSGRLEQLLARHSGRSAKDQVDFIQVAFDAQLSQLDRRQRELQDLRRQVELARQRMAADWAALERDRAQIQSREQTAVALQSDQGFQDSLERYMVMSGKQVKSIFMTLSDDIVVRYLQAMPPRTATRIIKEYKTPDELARVQRVMELMRTTQAIAAQTPAGATNP